MTHDFLIGVTEVTQAQFDGVMPYHNQSSYYCGESCAAENVSWSEAAAYANAMSDAAGLTECYVCTGSGETVTCDNLGNPYDCDGYRLPTEAEWEGSARCGTDLAYAGSNVATDVAWISSNSGAP